MRAIAFVLLAACGASPNQPVLANAPRPPTAAVAGGAAAAAAAITLADPDAASRRPEKNKDTEKKPQKVKENVPAGVFDRLESSPQPAAAPAPNGAAPTTGAKKQPAGVEDKPKAPKSALDFSEP